MSTGVFLALAHRLWQKIGSPTFTGPEMEKVTKTRILVENYETDEEEEIGSTGSSRRPGKYNSLLNPALMGDYPDFEDLRQRKLLRPNPSKRYGDPNDKKVEEWYAGGRTYPPTSLLKGNSLMRRRGHPGESRTANANPRKSSSASGSEDLAGRARQMSEMKSVEVIQNRFAAKPIKTDFDNISEKIFFGERIRNSFSKYSVEHRGTLFIQKDKQAQKWIDTGDPSRCPRVAPQLRYHDHKKEPMFKDFPFAGCRRF